MTIDNDASMSPPPSKILLRDGSSIFMHFENVDGLIDFFFSSSAKTDPGCAEIPIPFTSSKFLCFEVSQPITAETNEPHPMQSMRTGGVPLVFLLGHPLVSRVNAFAQYLMGCLRL
jgi:hypothetical protein